ncbi:hypothetical protein M413DRAFT_30239 [Hebeloma cylindrosporum]|uniref:DUF6534 domain-containing protein n=1 Tax=Hebeloma cylindrosporum TaxID=76867 RepID=A0A0C3BP18_HEBCY|nr:hypothetical protein M413DRAFT_30239 [Hebeloma cylindrosporum h7]
MTGKATVDNTLGAAFLGIAASCILIGISMVQTHSYYQSYPKDWMFQKVAVGVLMSLAILHTVFTIHAIYFYLIVNFGNPKGLGSVIWSVYSELQGDPHYMFLISLTDACTNHQLQVVFNTIMVLLVQGLYAMRVWKPSTPTVGVGFLSIVESFKQTSFNNLDSMKKVLYATFSIATGIDFVIAGAMCYYLNKSRSSFVGTNNKILTIMRYVLITGCVTSACSFSALITFATMPYNMVFLGIDFLLPNLYFTSYIAMLNARKSTNERETTSSADVSKVVHVRSGINIHVDDKITPDGIPLSETRFTPSFSNKFDPDHIGVRPFIILSTFGLDAEGYYDRLQFTGQRSENTTEANDNDTTPLYTTQSFLI